MTARARLRTVALGFLMIGWACNGSSEPPPTGSTSAAAQQTDRAKKEAAEARRDAEAAKKAAEQARQEGLRARLVLAGQQLDAKLLDEAERAIAALAADDAPAGDLKPLRARLAELRALAKKEADKLTELERLVEQADWVAAALLAEELVELAPASPRLAPLRARINAGAAANEHRSALLAEARQYLETRELERATTALEAARGHGASAELTELERAVAAARAQRDALDGEVAELARQIGAGNLDSVAQRIAALLASNPGHAGLVELQGRLDGARSANDVALRLQDAKLALGKGDLAAAARAAADGLQLDRAHVGLRTLAAEVQRKVNAEVGLLKVQWANRRIKKDVYLKVLVQLRAAQEPLALIHPPLSVAPVEIPDGAEADRAPAPRPAPVNNRLAWRLERGEYVQFALSRLAGDGAASIALPRARLGLHAAQLGAKGDGWSPDQRWLLPIAAALVLPGQVVGDGQSYRLVLEFRAAVDLAPVQLTLSAKRVGPAVFAQLPCTAIEVEGQWRAVPETGGTHVLQTGTLKGTVYFHPERGHVLGGELDNVWTLQATGASLPPVDERIHVRLELDVVLGLDGPRFQQLVDQAIALAIRTLRARQQADGGWHERSGYNALALLALLVGGVSADDPRIAAGIARVLEAPHTLTYDTAVALMMLEARHAMAPSELAKLTSQKRRAALDAVAARLSPGERAWAQGATRWLAANARTTNPYRWDYPTTDRERWDNSNTQYAALGLRSGATCGTSTPPEVWRAIVAHWLECQAASEGKVQLLAERTKGSAQTYDVDARGWNYTHDRRKAYGSMTCGGIGSLAIAASELQRQGALGTKDAERVRRAILDGIAWMQVHFDVTRNPGGPDRWLYYYLYGLERAGILGDFTHVGARDWYREGALELVFSPERWTSDTIDTAFVLLFLRRGTYPVEISR